MSTLRYQIVKTPQLCKQCASHDLHVPNDPRLLVAYIAHEESGQGLTEYVLILALVAVTCMISLAAFGDALQKPLEFVVDKLELSSRP